jgi:phage tail protein X
MQVIAKQNDTIDLICWRHYKTTVDVTEQVLEANPHLDLSSPFIGTGTKIKLPVIKPVSKTRTINLWD